MEIALDTLHPNTELKVCQKLKEDHEFILNYSDLIHPLFNKAKLNGLNEEFWKNIEIIKDFIKCFSDDYHHAKEENILFTYLSQPGVFEHCNPLEQMLYEHNLGREFLKEFENGILTKDFESAFKGATNWVNLIQSHIQKEDNILFPMSESGLNPDIKKKILKEFSEVDKAKNAQNLIEKYKNHLVQLKKLI